MKRILLLIAVYALSINCFSQNYHKFPDSNAIWQYIVTQSMVPPFEWTHIDSLGQHITIDSKDYIEVYSKDNVIGAVSEDTVERKIYFNNFESEIVLYDFSLNEGDTIFYTTNLFYEVDYYKVVNSIDSVEIDGEFRKRWHLENSMGNPYDTWIEGIGSVEVYGLLNPNDPDVVLDGSIRYFGCFSHDAVVYTSDIACGYGCPCEEWLVNSQDKAVEISSVKIFPNPVDNQLTIYMNGNHKKFSQLKLYTINNKMIYSMLINNNEPIVIDNVFRTSGVYFIKLEGNDGYEIHKILKK